MSEADSGGTKFFLCILMYYTYLARCSDDTLYTGYSRDVWKREARHNAGEGAAYTRSRLPVEVVYCESFPSRSEAMKREFQIKKWTRAEKENLVKSGCPSKRPS